MSDQLSVGEASAQRSPWSRPGVLLCGAFLLALALLAILVAATGGDGNGASHASSAAARPAAPTAPATRGGCTLPAGGQTVPSTGPPPARWGTVGSMQVPQSPAVYGPQRSDGPWETCFAHDPAGALLAAMNFYAESTTGEPEQTVMRRYAVGAPPRLGSNAGLDSSGPVQLAGYRYVSYTPARAQVAIVFAGPEGKRLAVVTAMVWSHGDWKYVFPAGGTPAMQVVPDLTGYVAWSGF